MSDTEGTPEPNKIEVARQKAIKKDEEAKAADKKLSYVVKKGGALTSLIGTIGEGTGVKPEFFAGGKATFDNLVEKGHIVKR